MTDRARELLERVAEILELLFEGPNDVDPNTLAMLGDTRLEEIRDFLSTPEPTQDEEPTKAEVAVYLFAGWLTCQPGIMEVGACCDASPMAQAIDQYFQEHPERMFETKLHPAPPQEFVRLSDKEISEIEASIPPKMDLAEAKKKFAQAIEDALEEKNK